MIRAFLGVFLLAVPASAMTPEDCDAALSRLGSVVSVADELQLEGGVSPEGWCRVEKGPLAGLDWRFHGATDGFVVEFSKAEFEVPDLGEFRLTGQILRQGSDYRVGPVLLRRDGGDAIVLNARLGGPDTGTDGLGSMLLDEAELMVAGIDGIVADVLAWVFRTDVLGARRNFTVADDQRAVMRDWIESLPTGLVDGRSLGEFRTLVRAYPQARGMAVLLVPEGGKVAIGPLLGALLFGTPFSEDAAATLVREAGLTFRWTPE